MSNLVMRQSKLVMKRHFDYIFPSASSFGYPCDPCGVKQRKDREAVIHKKRMTFPCLFSSPVPHQYACYVFSPRHMFLVTETQKTNQWEEHRRKQEAGRGEKSSFFLLRLRHARRRERNEERPLKNMSERTAVEEACCAPMDASAVAKLLMTQALMLVYIVSDAGRTLILQKAHGCFAFVAELSLISAVSDSLRWVTNSTVMGLVCFVVGVVVASCITAYFDGLEGLRCAWQPEKILQYTWIPVCLGISRL
eukprot:s1173_g7.t1